MDKDAMDVDTAETIASPLLGPYRAEEQARTSAPATIKISISHRLLSAARMPTTTSTRPRADSTAPVMSNGQVGSGGSGSLILRNDHSNDEGLENERSSPADRGGERPPISGPAAAPMPPMALITPNARARDVISVNSSVVRM